MRILLDEHIDPNVADVLRALRHAVVHVSDTSYRGADDGPLMQLAEQGELMAYPHYGYWQPMDTLHDKNTLEKLWANGSSPWKKWD